jgi:hypothetical protein
MQWVAVALIVFYMILRFFKDLFQATLATLSEPEPLAVFLVFCIAMTAAHIYDENHKDRDREARRRRKYGDRERRRIRRYQCTRRNHDPEAGPRQWNEFGVEEEIWTERYMDPDAPQNPDRNGGDARRLPPPDGDGPDGGQPPHRPFWD